jgi:hypothetical protein
MRCFMPRADLRATRANRVFGTDKKRIRTENTVMVESRDGLGFHTRSSIAHGCAFHPCAIDDPRGRILVRAISQLRENRRCELTEIYFKEGEVVAEGEAVALLD